MHVLILNYHPLQTQFLQKSLRYENIGADVCFPENLSKIWYGQYDALLIPLPSFNHPPFSEIQKQLDFIGKVPTLLTSKVFPPPDIVSEFQKNPHLQFVGSYESFPRLVHRLHSMIHSSNKENSRSSLKCGDLELNALAREAKRRDRLLALCNKEFALLECFMSHPGRVLTRSYLLETVWDRNTSVLSNTVDVHISRLRKKIDCGFTHSMLITIPCVGYKLIE